MKGQHVNSRKLVGASAASVGAATAVAALLLGTLSGSAGEYPTASAFGLAADGLLDIDPVPYVEAPPDERKALLEVPGMNRGDNLHVALLKVEAEHFRSKATAVKVDILGLRLKILEAKCDNGHGESSIISTDNDNKSSTYRGQELNLSPVIKIEFNRQFRDRDRLTVDAAVIKLLPGDHYGRSFTQKDLDLLRNLASNKLKVPAKVQDVKSERPGAPTVGDLVKQVKALNPSLSTPKGGNDALLEIVISSASCKEERRKEERKEEAPPPKPVEAKLPVTH
jgi:hypothetical protein